MSTYLQLAEKLRQNVPDIGGTPLVTVANQTGRMQQGINWLADAYSDIQNRAANWRWLKSQFTFNTVAGTNNYAWSGITDSRLSALITRFARWVPLDDRGYPNMKRYLTSTGIAAEGWLSLLVWNDFKKVYLFGARTLNQGSPIHVTIDPQNQLLLGMKPNDIYTITGEYMMGPQILAADGDTPEMPVRFHDLIMYRAMEKIAIDLSATELLDRARTEGMRLMRALEAEQLPTITTGEPLV